MLIACSNLYRLRHLEEVDILRHLSREQHQHVIAFVDAWEQVSSRPKLREDAVLTVVSCLPESTTFHSDGAILGNTSILSGGVWSGGGKTR